MGGFWNISPIKELMTFSIWSSVGLLSDFWITLPSESSVSVLSPHFTVKEYFLFFSWTNEIHFVASPTAIGKTPVAIGSKVPAWPTFLIFNNLEIRVTACLEVTPICLSRIIHPLILLMINFLLSSENNVIFLDFLKYSQYFWHFQMNYLF